MRKIDLSKATAGQYLKLANNKVIKINSIRVHHNSTIHYIINHSPEERLGIVHIWRKDGDSHAQPNDYRVVSIVQTQFSKPKKSKLLKVLG